MHFRKIFAIAAVAALFTAGFPAEAQNNKDADDGIELLVPIPNPPASITRLDERCNYILDHFWDNFNYKNAFSAQKRFDKTLGQFFAFTPYATADTVHIAVDRLINNFAKAKPQLLVDLCAVAEKWTHGDSAEYASDELYFPFVDAVVKNKKAKGPQRARFEAQHRQMLNSMVGSDISNFEFTKPDGSKATMADARAPHVMLIFADPDCADCLLTKARLSADFVIEALVKNDILKVVVIYPGEANDEAWMKEAASMPEGWIVGANPEADLLFEIPDTPTIYYLNDDLKVKVKNVAVDNILMAFHSLIQNAVNEQNAASDTPEQPASTPNE